ncbi:P-loop containing nucleoside triphosphate hydrolase [Pseudocohnilembus persalinus]|uniref:p-loop containing nucleoside triphosphate hydrolase n=1 Tax=Pseudocohnilembus persalinus TaxID=266149 RepID=A0A0V0QZB1_PSEPJ|nr:P-loop containing nucleoside triphosphate hydrolase [Pseudocohnilembus persalinus]|eukprot:KRX07572.1 P-loop containing nucleoside triphosphate hydrolase [Pseudocohnilembus persalinus]
MNSQNSNQYDDNKENMPNEQNLQQNMFQIGSQVTENDQNKVEGQKKNNKRTLETLYTDFDKQKSFQSLIDSLSVILQDIGLEDKNQKDCSLQMSQNEQNELNGILKDLRIEENQLKEFKMSCHKNIDNFDKEQDMLLNLQRICKKLQKLRFEDQYDDITKFDIQQDEIIGLNEQIKKLVLSKNDEIKKLITSIQQLDKTISEFQENLKNLKQNQKSNDLNNQSQLQQIDSQKLRKDLKFVIIGDKKIELSDMQIKIINAPLNQNLLVQSVAGSGKTTTMAIRVQRMIQDGIKPEEMMILTFNITAGQAQDWKY